MQTLHNKLDILNKEIKQIAKAIVPQTPIELDYSYYEIPQTNELSDQDKKGSETDVHTST